MKQKKSLVVRLRSLIAAVTIGLGLIPPSFAEDASLVGAWRWTSNATATSPTWTSVDSTTLSVPAGFTGTTAEDNVIELLEDCKVTSILVFNKSCTIRTAPSLEVKKVTFTKNYYCISTAGADVRTTDITFTGGAQWKNWTAETDNSDTVGNCAWAVIGTASLTLGSGTTVRNFLTSIPTGIDMRGGAIILPTQTTAASPLGGNSYGSSVPKLTISEGAKILDVRGNGFAAVTIFHSKAVVDMTGGEVSGCYNGDGNGAIFVEYGMLNLSGGQILNNYTQSGKPVGGINVGNSGTLNLSGKPVVQGNYIHTSNTEFTPSNLKANGNTKIHLTGDLEEDASVGCSQNIGKDNQFGVADGNFAGARRILADNGSELVGKVSGGNLVWGENVGPEPNKWTTPAAISKTSWVKDEDDPGVITVPVAEYNDDLKEAKIAKDGEEASEWDGEMPTTAGSYEITWTVPETDEYGGLTAKVTFSILATRPQYVKVGMDWTWSPWQDLSSFTKSASATIGWRAEGADTVDSTHTVSADYDYVVPADANLSTGGNSDESMTFAGHKLILETYGKLVAFRDKKVQTVTVNHLVAKGGELAGRNGDTQFKTFAGNFDLSKGDLGLSCDTGMKIEVTATVTGGHDIFLVGSKGNSDSYQLQLTGDMSKWTGTMKKADAETSYTDKAYQLTVSGEFGGSFTSIPEVDANTDSYAAFNYDNLVDGATKGLKIGTVNGAVDESVKKNVVLYSSSADFAKESLPIMTFPAGTNVRASEFTVRHAESASGDKTAFTHLWLRPNADGTKTLVANSRGLMLIFGL